MAIKQLTLPEGREGIPLKVVAAPAFAAPNRADGRLVPVAILDTTDRPDFAALIRIHAKFDAGDVDVQWAWSRDFAEAYLILYFRRPTELAAVVEFDIATQWALVDQIILIRSLYIHAGKPGDKFATMVDSPSIFIEVPVSINMDRWERVALKTLGRDFRKHGLSRWEAKRAARDALLKQREVGAFRMRRS